MSDSFKKLSRREFIALSGTVIGSLSVACAQKEPAKQAKQAEFPQWRVSTTRVSPLTPAG